MNDKTSRRSFLRGSGAGMAAGLAATRPPAAASANLGPNDTINLGLIGCGARGRGVHIPVFQKLPGARLVAVCDVNSRCLADGRERAGGDRVAAYSDYRKLLENKDVDAVIIGTNQHWQVLTTIGACPAGKDVYVEKPVGNFIAEGRFAIEAARKYGRIVQIGTQKRSQEHYRKAIEIVQPGRLGQISEVMVWDYENQSPGAGSPPDCDPPAELDGKCFLGTQASMPVDRSGCWIVEEPRTGKQPAPAGNVVNAEEGIPTVRDDNRHFEVFLDNVRGRKQPLANLQTDYYATNVGHLMNIDWEVRRTIRWNGEKEQIAGDAQATALLRKPYRAPWKLAA